MAENNLLISETDGVLTVQFNRPEAMNALTATDMVNLTDNLSSVPDSVRVVVFKGHEHAFCAGADVTTMDLQNAASTLGMEKVTKLMHTIRDIKVPTLAVVSGAAAGIGCSLALICDYVLMSEKSYLMLAFAKIGLMPDGGATTLVAASAGRHRAMRMALTAEKLQAATAFEWGLASEVVDPSQLNARAGELAQTFVASASEALAYTKHAINTASLTELDSALDLEAAGQGYLRTTADYVEGVTAFREKRPAVFGQNQE